MRLTIPVTPATASRLPELLNTLTSVHPGQGHQVFILTTLDSLTAAEQFAHKLRQQSKFAGVILSSLTTSQMAHPDNSLWIHYFSQLHPTTLWLDAGAHIVATDGWLTTIEDSLRFATSPVSGPQSTHTTAVYLTGAHKRLQAWRCPCVKTQSPAHVSHESAIRHLYRESPLFFAADSVEEAPPAAIVIVPKKWHGVVKVAEPASAPEIVKDEAPEVVKVDTEAKSEVNAPAPPKLVRRVVKP
jgi:hypothetical protein